jgi:hypothetical protein
MAVPPGALVGIVWLIPVFGIYFALRLVRAGDAPSGIGKALGVAGLVFVVTTALTIGVFKVFPSPVAQLGIFTLISFFWTALLPQLSVWIYLTVVAGMFFGALAVGIRRLVRRGPADVAGASVSRA